MSKYSLVIQLERQAGDNASVDKIRGVLGITAHEACTCRKLVLKWVCWKDASEKRQIVQKSDQVLVKWEEWQPNQTYSHSFEFAPRKVAPRSAQGLLDPQCSWYVQPEVHLVGDFQPDASYDWIAASGGPADLAAAPPSPGLQEFVPEEMVQPAAPDGSETLSAADRGQDIHLDPVQPAQPAVLVPGRDLPEAAGFHMALLLDKPDRNYQFGDTISGRIEVEADRDYIVEWLGVYYQWRRLKRGSSVEGEPVDTLVAEGLVWEAGQRYVHPFTFVVDSGPIAEQGDGQSLAWFLWPEIDVAPSLAVSLDQVETEFHLRDSNHPIEVQEAVSEQTPPEAVPSAAARVILISQERPGLVPPVVYHFVWPLGLLLFLLGFCYNVSRVLSGDPPVGQIGIGLILLVIIFYRSYTASMRVLSYQIAERRLGPVGVAFNLSPEADTVTGRLTFTPLETVELSALAMKLNVLVRVSWTKFHSSTFSEVTRRGTRVKRSKTSEKELGQRLRAGEPFSQEILVTFPETGLSSNDLLNAEVRVKIGGWFDWKRTYNLSVA